MSEHSDVLIIGGGVIGLTTAYYLARGGGQVTVVDQGDLGQQASWAGAGIIPPASPALAQTAYDLLRAQSAAMFPRLSQELREETGLDNGYVVCGGVEVVEASEEAPDEEWQGVGIAFEPVDGWRLSQLVPGLSPHVQRGYFLPAMAQVRNPRHLQALQVACASRGVVLRPHCPVRSLARQGGRVVAVETATGCLSAGNYLLSAGAWTEDLLAPLGWRPGIRPVRGQIALLNTDKKALGVVILAGKRYIVPRQDGRILIGSTEEDAGFDARPTGGGVAGLLTFAAELLPALADAPLERCWAGLRPGSPDGMPYLGQVPGCDNLFVAAGHFRAGIQLSPATGVALAEVLLGRPAPSFLQELRLDRPGPSPQQASSRA
jgi:glycine oxidase